MTIEQLKNYCLKEIKKGNGKKEIWVSDDNDGNGYHQLLFAFSDDVEGLDIWGQFEKGDNERKIILG